MKIDLVEQETKAKRRISKLKKALAKVLHNPKYKEAVSAANKVFDLYRELKTARLGNKAAILAMLMRGLDELSTWCSPKPQSNTSKVPPAQLRQQNYSALMGLFLPSSDPSVDHTYAWFERRGVKKQNVEIYHSPEPLSYWLNWIDTYIDDQLFEEQIDWEKAVELWANKLPNDSKPIFDRMMSVTNRVGDSLLWCFDEDYSYKKVTKEFLEEYPIVKEQFPDFEIYELDDGAFRFWIAFGGATYAILREKNSDFIKNKSEKLRRWVTGGYTQMELRRRNQMWETNPSGSVDNAIETSFVKNEGEEYIFTRTTQKIKDDLETMIAREEPFFALIYGRAGSGKTSFIQEIAKKMQVNLIDLNWDDFRNKNQLNYDLESYVYDLDPVNNVFIINDIDRIGFNLIDFDKLRRLLGGFVVFMTANDITNFDSAIFRPKRIGYIVNLDLNKEDKLDFLSKRLPNPVVNYIKQETSSVLDPFLEVVFDEDFTTDFIRWTCENLTRDLPPEANCEQKDVELAIENHTKLAKDRLTLMKIKVNPMNTIQQQLARRLQENM